MGNINEKAAEKNLLMSLIDLSDGAKGETDLGVGTVSGDTYVSPCTKKLPEVRAELLRWLLLEPEWRDHMKRGRGLRISDVSVTGQLRLDDIDADFAVVLKDCCFEKLLSLQHGRS